MRVLGLDPGLRVTGWGVIDARGSEMSHVANGVCRSAGENLAERLHSLHSQLTDVIREYQPDEAAVEQVFVNTDGRSSLKLGQARAIALLVAAQAGLNVGEYAPNTVKKVVVGVGHAQKNQVEHMIRLQLPGARFTKSDEADALAVAMTHAVYGNFTGVVSAVPPVQPATKARP